MTEKHRKGPPLEKRRAFYWDGGNFVPVAADMPGRYWPLTVNYYIREAFAAAKLLVFDR